MSVLTQCNWTLLFFLFPGKPCTHLHWTNLFNNKNTKNKSSEYPNNNYPKIKKNIFYFFSLPNQDEPLLPDAVQLLERRQHLLHLVLLLLLSLWPPQEQREAPPTASELRRYVQRTLIVNVVLLVIVFLLEVQDEFFSRQKGYFFLVHYREKPIVLV